MSANQVDFINFEGNYQDKVESLRFAAIFKAEMQSKLGWDEPFVTNSYLPALRNAIELAQANEIEVLYHDGQFPMHFSRITDACRHDGEMFRLAVFPEFDVAYMMGVDYVGDELVFIGAKNFETIKRFYNDVKTRYKAFAKKEGEKKITIYTVENGQAKIHKTPFTHVTRESMVADADLLSEIEADLATFFEGDEIFQYFDITQRRAVMFEGPPGCGKTMMCKYIATISKAPVVQFFASAGCDTGDLLKFFQYVSDIAPAIVILEDLDSLFKGDLARSNFLNIVDGAATDKNAKLLILATTNHVKELDEALNQRPGRMDRIYKFDYPKPELRRDYVLKRFAKVKHLVEDPELVQYFVDKTERMSFAHLNEIYTQAALKAIKNKKKKLYGPDIEEAIKNVTAETTKKGSSVGIKYDSALGKISSKTRVYDYDDDDMPYSDD